MEGLSSPIDFASLKKCSELETMEYSGMQQGTLFKLTKSEYDFILDMIREDNPISDGKEKAAYLKQNFLNDVYITEAKYDRLTAVLKKKKEYHPPRSPRSGENLCSKKDCLFDHGGNR